MSEPIFHYNPRSPVCLDIASYNLLAYAHWHHLLKARSFDFQEKKYKKLLQVINFLQTEDLCIINLWAESCSNNLSLRRTGKIKIHLQVTYSYKLVCSLFLQKHNSKSLLQHLAVQTEKRTEHVHKMESQYKILLNHYLCQISPAQIYWVPIV